MRLLQTLYADVLFIIDFSMDVISLWLTARLTCARAKALRISAAAAIGALASTVCTALDANKLISLLAGALSALVMCIIAFGIMKPRALFKGFIYLWLVGVLIGGVMTFLIGLGEGDIYSPKHDGGGGMALLLPIGAAVSFIFVRLVSRITSKRSVSVRLEALGEALELCGIVDSGNLLVDPISCDPVIVLSRGALTKGEELSGFLSDARVSQSESLATRFRLIPASSLFGSGMLRGFRPDEIRVDGIAVKAIVAISQENDDILDCAECIVPAVLVK